jgi:predicted  nucleic acid-binding Zn-ribbon protein
MKKLILIGIGLAVAAGFIGFDAVHAFVDKTRSDVRSKLMSPEMEIQAKLSEAKELSEKCGESVINGRVAMVRLDTMIEERAREIDRREKYLDRDRRVLESRQTLLQENRTIYLIGNDEVSRRTLNRDALLRAKAYSTDREIYQHCEETLAELKVQRAQTAAEIEEATVEQKRLHEEVSALKAELENLKARRAVAQTREEAAYIFDRSTFDQARDKIAEIRATIAEQNKRLDFYGRLGSPSKGLIPAGEDALTEDGAEAIAAVLAEDRAPLDEEVPVTAAIRR